MEKRDFLSVHTIVCPECKMKQTGFVRESPGILFFIPSKDLNAPRIPDGFRIPFGRPYIRCSYIPCQFPITGDALEECTRQTVQFPNQINK